MQRLAEQRMKKLSSMKPLKGPYSVKISDVKTGAWRKARPVIARVTCIKCGICQEYCPCGVIEKTDDGMAIDYTYCKGCGICAEECPKNAITLVNETLFEEEVK